MIKRFGIILGTLVIAVGLSRSLPVSIGERLLIRANLKENKLFNGNIVEVASVREDGTIILKNDRTIPPQFRQFSHGYLHEE